MITQYATILESTVVDCKLLKDKISVSLGGTASGPNKLYHRIIALQGDTILHGG